MTASDSISRLDAVRPAFTKEDRHFCEGDLPEGGWGVAMYECKEDDQGRLWISNGEYASAVNFCPYCGYKAEAQVHECDET